MLPSTILTLVACLAGCAISPVLARMDQAPDQAIAVFSEPNYKGTRVELELNDDKRDKCVKIPAGTIINSIRMPGGKDGATKWPCCAFFRSDCLPEAQGQFPQIMRSLYQMIGEDATDLTPTGFGGDTLRGFICMPAEDCLALEADQPFTSDRRRSMYPYWTTITDLPAFIHEDGKNDMVKDLLGQR